MHKLKGYLQVKVGRQIEHRTQRKTTKLNRRLLMCFERDLSSCIWPQRSAERTEVGHSLV